jgi:glycosyltransferase involved in cell wall biosynthesis
MRVLHVITRLSGGGAQANTVRTAILHRQAGIGAEILHGAAEGNEHDLTGAARDGGVPLHRLALLRRAPSPFHDLAATALLTRFLRETHFDIVHTHTSKAGFIGRLAARLAAVPVVIHTPHGHVFHSYYGPLTTRLYVRLERSAAHWTRRIVALTPREREEHLDLGIGDRRQFEVVPSGIELERFRPSPERRERARSLLGATPADFVVGVIGRLVPVKGQDTLLSALPLLLRHVADARVDLVGDGDQRDHLAALPERLGVARRVRFHGHRTDPESLLAGFDILAVPSRNEGMGRVVIEAMVARVPVVASAVGGILDLIEPGVTGTLVPPADPAALAHALRSVAERPEHAATMVAEAAAYAGHRFSEEAMAEDLLRIYQSALDGGVG